MAELQLGNIKPAGADNVVVDSKYVKGGYTTVSTIADRNALSASGQTVINGSLCYVATGDGTGFYQYNGSTWEEANLGGEMTSDNTGGMWISARSNALIRNIGSTTDSSYAPILSCKTSIGEISQGIIHPTDKMVWSYTTDENFNANQNTNTLLMELTTSGSLTVTETVTADSFNATSDARLKENFVEYTPDKSILDLPVYTFDFIDGAKNQLGCKAQDLQKICPEIVNEGSNGYLSIQESKIVYLLLEETRQLKKQIAELEERLDELSSK